MLNYLEWRLFDLYSGWNQCSAFLPISRWFRNAALSKHHPLAFYRYPVDSGTPLSLNTIRLLFTDIPLTQECRLLKHLPLAFYRYPVDSGMP